jgi:succinoglycan biosynthesis transport protein ExoP
MSPPEREQSELPEDRLVPATEQMAIDGLSEQLGRGGCPLGAGELAAGVQGLMILDRSLCVRMANPTFYATFRITREETIGRVIFEVGHGQWDVPALRDWLGKVVLREPCGGNFVLKYHISHLGPRAFRLNARRIPRQGDEPTLILLGVEDVTEVGAIQEESKTPGGERQGLAAPTDPADSAVLVTDAWGRTIWANEAFTRLCGYRLDELVGRIPNSLLQGPETDQATIAYMRRRMGEGEGFNVEVLNYTKLGHTYWAAVETQPIRDNLGAIVSFASLINDITARRGAQHAPREARPDLSSPLPGSSHGLRSMGEVPGVARWPSPDGTAQGPMAAASRGSTAPDKAALLRAFRRRWTVALPAALAAAAVVALGVWHVLPKPKFTAQASLKIAAQPPIVLFTTAESRTDYGTYQRTQVALIKGRSIFKKFLNRPEIAGMSLVRAQRDPIKWLEEEVRVDFAGGSEILRVSLSGDQPRDLATLVNGLVEVYVKEVEDQERRARQGRLVALKETHQRYQATLKSKQQEMKKLAESVGTNDKTAVALRQQFDLERLTMAQRDLVRLRSDLKRAQVELAVAEQFADTQGVVSQSAMLEKQLAGDPVAEKHAGRIAQLEARVRQVRRLSRQEADPSLQETIAELRVARDALDGRRAELARLIDREAPKHSNDESTNRLEVLRQRVAVLTEDERALSKEVDDLSAATRSLNLGSLDIATTQDEVVYLVEMARKIRTEVEATDVELQAPPRVCAFERADVPRSKDITSSLEKTGMAAAGTFSLLLFGLTYREVLRGRIDSTEAVSRGLGLRVLGTLPKLPDRDRRRLTDADDAGRGRRLRLYQESVDAARALLLHILDEGQARVVLITSALEGESKTSVACHLAASFARAGRVTLLVDGDLQRSTASRLFDLARSPGFCELLRGEVRIADVLHTTPLEGLSLLPAGEIDAKAQQALARGDAGPIFATLRSSYEIIVVDTSPVIPVTDPLLLGQHADVAILAVLKDVSCRPSIRLVSERLSSLGIRVAGVVISGMVEVPYRYRYRYRYHRARRAAMTAAGPSGRTTKAAAVPRDPAADRITGEEEGVDARLRPGPAASTVRIPPHRAC